MKTLEILFRSPGLVEAIVSDPNEAPEETFVTEGYRSVWVADLMADYDPKTGKPYSFISQHFHKTYPLVIWALKMHVHERFDVPQMGISNVPLHEAFSWAYYHFILEDGKRLQRPLTTIEIDPSDYTQMTLGYALTTN